ncbi:MAG TPA: hypothetical protein ENN79_02375 [Desulfobacteraceae bacterium]|nr:hypothetical protein [Desulfobacteraceae bacterium]
MKRLAWILGVCMLLTASWLVAEDLIVNVEGQAAGSGPAARERAVEDALRNALEKGLGVFVDSTTLVENASLISDDTLVQTRGLVRDYTIEHESEQDGLTVVRVRAVISLQKVWESETLALLLRRMQMPRFVIVSTVEVNQNQLPPGHPVAQKLAEELVNRGFLLQELPKIHAMTKQDSARIVAEPALVAGVLPGLQAEVVVLASSRADFEKKADLYGRQMAYFSALVEVKAFRRDSMRVIAAVRGKAIRGAEQPEEAIHDALTWAAGDAAEKLVPAILTAWTEQLNRGREIGVTVHNLSVSQLSRLVDAIRSIEGVSSVSQRGFSLGKADLEVVSKQPAFNLAQAMENLPGLELKVNACTANHIRLKIEK